MSEPEPVTTELCDHFLKAKRGTTRLWAHRYPHLLPVIDTDDHGRPRYFVADVQAVLRCITEGWAKDAEALIAGIVSDQRERISA